MATMVRERGIRDGVGGVTKQETCLRSRESIFAGTFSNPKWSLLHMMHFRGKLQQLVEMQRDIEKQRL